MTPEKRRRTFISYSRINKEFALKLALELRSSGFNIWLDQLDIPPGARWDDAVEQALEDCEIFLVVLTPASSASNNVKDEIGYAIDTGKRILPILLKNARIPLRLRRFQYVDFTSKSDDEGIESAKQLLRKLIEEPTIPREQASVVAQMQKAKAEEEVDHLKVQKAEEKRIAEQLAAQKAEAERKAKEEAEQLASQKAEEERIARERHAVEQLAAQKAEADRKAKEEAERLVKAEANRKAKEQAEHKPKPEKQSEPVTSTTLQRKPISRGLVVGIVAFVVLVIAGIGISALSNRGTPAADTPSISTSATQPNAANTPKPTPIPLTPIPMATFLNASDTKTFYESENWINIYSLAREQHTEDEIKSFKDHNEWIPVKLDESKPMGAHYGWCALNADILQDNLDQITFFFEFNGLPISKRNVADVYYTNEDGWECIQKVIAIDEWGTGEYHLSYGLSINQKLNDGEYDYNAGDSGRIYLVVTVP